MPVLLLSAASCALFAWLNPTHDLPWSSFFGEVAMTVSGLFLTVAVFIRSPSGINRLPLLAVLALFAALIPLTQTATHLIRYRGDGALACLYTTGFALAVTVGYRATRIWKREAALECLSWVILPAAIVSVWLALYQWQQLDYLGIYTGEISVGRRPFANFNQPNLLATLLVLGIVSVGHLFDIKRVHMPVALLCVTLLAFGLASTQSRTGLLEILVGATLLLVRRRHLRSTLQTRHVLAALGVVVSMSALWSTVRDMGAEPTGRPVTEMLRPGVRGSQWIGMIDATSRRPWLGYGWGQGGEAQYLVAPLHPPGYEVFDYGHNIALDLIQWNGFPLGLLLVGGLGLWFLSAARRSSDSTTLLALTAVIAAFVHASLEFPLYYSFFLLPIGALMGGISAVAMPKATVTAPVWFVPALAAGATAVFAVVVSDYAGLARDAHHLRFERAHIVNPGGRYELSNPVLLNQIRAFNDFARTPERRGMTPDELEAMAAIVRRYPSGPNVVRYAAALTLNHRAPEAVDALRRVCLMEPPHVCKQLKTLWHGLMDRYPELASADWPSR